MRKLFFLLLTMAAYAVNGQTITITTSSNAPVPLPPKTINYINSGLASGDFLEVRYISTSPFLALGETSVSSATVHLGELSLLFESQAHLMDEEGYLKFTGNNSNGYIGLVSHYDYDGLSGYIQTNQGYWDIITIAEDVSIVIQVNQGNSSGSTIKDCFHSGTSESSSIVNLCDEANDCKSLVDVLVMVPPDVKTWHSDKYGGLYSSDYATFLHIQSSLLSANHAIQNSTDFNFSLAESRRMGVRYRLLWIDNFNYSNAIDPRVRITQDINNLSSNYTAQKDFYNADVLCLWTSVSYGNYADGVANNLDPANGNSAMISRVQQHVGKGWTHAHEIGHLAGARHNRTSNISIPMVFGDDEDICNHAWRFGFSGIMDRTILSVSPREFEHILHYSNPEINFSGDQTGTEDDNNSLAIINGNCALEEVRLPAFLSVLLYGQRTVCLSEFEQIITAEVKEAALGNIGHPPYDYFWSIKSGPGTIVTMPFANYVTLQYDNCLAGCEIIVSCGVRSADSQAPYSGWSYDEIKINVDAGCRMSKEKENPVVQLSLYPNPVSDYLNVSLGNNEIGEVKIIDLQGKIIKISKNTRRINISDIPSGTYIVQTYINKEIKYKKFIKL